MNEKLTGLDLYPIQLIPSQRACEIDLKPVSAIWSGFESCVKVIEKVLEVAEKNA